MSSLATRQDLQDGSDDRNRPRYMVELIRWDVYTQSPVMRAGAPRTLYGLAAVTLTHTACQKGGPKTGLMTSALTVQKNWSESLTEYGKIETLYERDERTHCIATPHRLKNPVYGWVNPWIFTEKIDGMNVRCIWQYDALKFAGRTDNAAFHPSLLEWLQDHVTPELMAATFPDHASEVPIVLYGEGYGAGIQKGGGAYSPTKKFVLFDVLVGSTDHPWGWWLSDENMRSVARKIGIDAVPLFGECSLDEATDVVQKGFQSALGSRDAEGLVGRPKETLYDKRGNRLIVKLKTRDFRS